MTRKPWPESEELCNTREACAAWLTANGMPTAVEDAPEVILRGYQVPQLTHASGRPVMPEDTPVDSGMTMGITTSFLGVRTP